MRFIWHKAMLLLTALLAAAPAGAQERQEPDRSDPAVIEQELDRDRQQPQGQRPRLNVAPPTAPGAASRGSEVLVGAVHVRGATSVPSAAFAPAIEPFLGRPLGQDELVQLATAIANVARRSGYGLATAWVPPQDVEGGVLTVQVDEGRIDAVRVTGPGARFVEPRLSPVVGSGPVRTDRLERQLMLAGDAAGLWVGDARLIREGERNVLVVATRYQRIEGRATIDNWGSDTVGPIRAWAEVDVNGVITPGDGLTLGLATTPLEPQTFHLLEAHYRLPFGGRGTTVGIGGYYGRTDVEPSIATAGFQGDSWEVDLDASHPLARSRATSLWLAGRFELRDSRLSRGATPIREDRVATGTVTLHGFTRFAGGRLRMRASLVQGLDLFGATRSGDPLASRSDAGGVFTKFEGWAEYRRSFGRFSAEIALRSQISDGPLLSSEEMGLGGPQFLRAFDYRERSGDDGVAGSLELQFDLGKFVQGIQRVQLYGYADAGRVANHGLNGSGGSLASAGGGVRVWLNKHLQAGFELGVPLTDGATDRDPNPRFSFSVRSKF